MSERLKAITSNFFSNKAHTDRFFFVVIKLILIKLIVLNLNIVSFLNLKK